MKKYLLDTSVLAAFLNKRPGTISLIKPWISANEVTTSLLVYGEVIEYLKNKPSFKSHQKAARDLLKAISPYSLSVSVVELYADIRLSLRRGKLIGDIDTLIAATALNHNLTLVTIDPDFKRVPDLKLMLLTRDQLY